LFFIKYSTPETTVVTSITTTHTAFAHAGRPINMIIRQTIVLAVFS
jgi:hypothetical protein